MKEFKLPEKFANIPVSEMNNVLEHPDKYNMTMSDLFAIAAVWAEISADITPRKDVDKLLYDFERLAKENQELKEKNALLTNRIKLLIGLETEIDGDE